MNSISKNKKKRTIIILILSIISLIVLSSIVYGAFSSIININGVGYARIEKDVRITDFKLSSSSVNSTSAYEEFSVNTFSSKFNLLSDMSSVVFDIEVTNYGSSDVGIFQFTGTIPEGLSYEIVNYNLKEKLCDNTGKCNGMAVKTFQIKFTGSKGEYEITQELDFRVYHQVSYTGIVNYNYPTEVIDGDTLNVTFKEDLKRILVMSNEIEKCYYEQISNDQTIKIENIINDIEFKRKEYGAKLINGSLETVGSEICIGEECFYIISNDGSTIAMLAKYNLYVGGFYNGSSWTAYGDEATGIQDSTMLGAVSGQIVSNGTTPFSSTNYWSSTVSTYPAYVYDSSSTQYNYVENYRIYLESQGAAVEEARLIKYEELTALGCSRSSVSCKSAPEWICGTSYWSGAAYNSDCVWNVYSSGEFYGSGSSYSRGSGVRPVIELPVEEVEPLVNVVSGNYHTVGSEIDVGREHFYVISSNEESVTMLAKYNLYVGFECETDVPNTCVAYGDAATGIQDPTMLGHKTTPRRGTIAFSNDTYKGENYSDYVGSRVEICVDNYNTYLENLGVDIQEARLITLEELEVLGCSSTGGSCKKAPSWVYATAYWTGTAYNEINIWRVSSSSSFLKREYTLRSSNGVRPVIKILLTEF